jgi:hypothetical protein
MVKHLIAPNQGLLQYLIITMEIYNVLQMQVLFVKMMMSAQISAIKKVFVKKNK